MAIGVNPTAWAHVPDPGIRKGVQQGLGAISQGRQDRRFDEQNDRLERQDVRAAGLHERVMELKDLNLMEEKRQLAKLRSVDSHIADVRKAHKSGDKKAFDEALLNYSYVDPEGAKLQAEAFTELDWQNMVEASYPIMAATVLDDVEAQNILLAEARDKLNINPNNPIAKGMDRLIAMPAGKKRNELMFETVNWLKEQGVYGEEAMKPKVTGKAGKTPEQIERGVVSTEILAKASADRVVNQADQTALEREKFETRRDENLPATILKSIDTADAEAFKAQSSILKGDILIADMERLKAEDVKGGITRTFQQRFREAIGSQGDTERFYTKYKLMRGVTAMKNLPPGAASDPDVALALKGVPAENAPPEEIVEWVKGVNKLLSFDNIYWDTRSRYISGNKKRGAAGFNKHWKENRAELLSGIFEKSEAKTYSTTEAAQQAIDNKELQAGDTFIIGDKTYEVKEE